MNAEELTDFLLHWVSLQRMRGRAGTPWTHEIQVPQGFEGQVREMSFRPETASRIGWNIEIRGIQFASPREQWRGWMAFMGYPLVLTEGKVFRIVPRTPETIRLVQGG